MHIMSVIYAMYTGLRPWADKCMKGECGIKPPPPPTPHSKGLFLAKPLHTSISYTDTCISLQLSVDEWGVSVASPPPPRRVLIRVCIWTHIARFLAMPVFELRHVYWSTTMGRQMHERWMWQACPPPPPYNSLHAHAFESPPPPPMNGLLATPLEIYIFLIR